MLMSQAETDKLIAEQHKLLAEALKLAAEEFKEKDWLSMLAGLGAGVGALIGAFAVVYRLLT